MENKVYQLEFIGKDNVVRENKVYSDLENVIWSLKEEGYKQESGSLLQKLDVEGNEVYVVIQEVVHFEGRLMPKEHVYLRDTE